MAKTWTHNRNSYWITANTPIPPFNVENSQMRTCVRSKCFVNIAQGWGGAKGEKKSKFPNPCDQGCRYKGQTNKTCLAYSVIFWKFDQANPLGFYSYNWLKTAFRVDGSWPNSGTFLSTLLINNVCVCGRNLKQPFTWVAARISSLEGFSLNTSRSLSPLKFQIGRGMFTINKFITEVA